LDSDFGLTGEFTFLEEQTKFEPKFGPSLPLLHCLLAVSGALVLEGEHLGDLPDPLGPPLPEQHPGATLHKLRVLDKLEHDRGLVAALEPPEGLDALYHRRLPDIPYVHRSSETPENLCGVEEDTDVSLRLGER